MEKRFCIGDSNTPWVKNNAWCGVFGLDTWCFYCNPGTEEDDMPYVGYVQYNPKTRLWRYKLDYQDADVATIQKEVDAVTKLIANPYFVNFVKYDDKNLQYVMRYYIVPNFNDREKHPLLRPYGATAVQNHEKWVETKPLATDKLPPEFMKNKAFQGRRVDATVGFASAPDFEYSVKEMNFYTGVTYGLHTAFMNTYGIRRR